MIRTYGVEMVGAGRPEGGAVFKRAEVPARDAAEAREYMRGWGIVQGHDVSHATITVLTHGETFRERMTRELVNAGARLSLRHGVAVIGPFKREPLYEGDSPRSIIRLELPNAWAVSLSSKLSSGFLVDTNMVTGHVVGDGDDFETEFVPGVMEYDSSVSVTEGEDAEIVEVINGLAKLPPRR